MAGEWRGRIAISLSGAAQIGSMILMGTAMAVYVGRRGSPFAVGMVTTAYFLGTLVFAPVWGAVADATGRRKAVLVGTGALTTLATLPLAVTDGVWLPIGFRWLAATFTAGYLPVMLTVVAERGGASSRGRTIGTFNSARSVGFTGARFFAGVLLGLLVPSALYLVIAGVSLVATLAVLFVDDPTPSGEIDLTLAAIGGEVRARLFPVEGRAHLRTNGLQWLYVALMLRNVTWLGLASLLPVYLIVEVGASEFGMGTLLAIAPAIEIAGMYLFGRAADARGRKSLIVGGVAAHALIALVMAAATLPASPLVGQAIAGAGIALKGVAFSAMSVATAAFIGDVSPVDRESELMGLRSTAKGLGGVTGPVLIGALATVTSYEAAFVAASGLALVGALLVWRLLVESHPSVGAAAAGVDG